VRVVVVVVEENLYGVTKQKVTMHLGHTWASGFLAATEM